MFCFPNLCFFQLPYNFMRKNNRRKLYRSTRSLRLAVKTKLFNSLAFTQLDPGRPRGPPYLHKRSLLTQENEPEFLRSESSHVVWPIRASSTLRARLRAVSLFSWSVEQNARDTQMSTRVTECARRERHDNARARVHSPY